MGILGSVTLGGASCHIVSSPMEKLTWHGKELWPTANEYLRPVNNHVNKLGWKFSSSSQESQPTFSLHTDLITDTWIVVNDIQQGVLLTILNAK